MALLVCPKLLINLLKLMFIVLFIKLCYIMYGSISFQHAIFDDYENFEIVEDSFDGMTSFDDDSLCPGPPIRAFLPSHLTPLAQPLVKLQNFNLSLCTIPKVASWTFMRIALKMIHKHNGNDTPFPVDSTLFQALGPPPNKSWTDPNWDHIIFARDPIQRFISSWLDICVLRKFCQIKNGTTMGKFIQTIYQEIQALDRQGKKQRNFLTEYHFWPQSWFCGLDESKLSAMHILKLDKSNPIFKEHLLRLLTKHKVRPVAVNYTQYLLDSVFTHNTKGSDKDSRYTELYRDKRLLYCLLKMYKTDFELFHLDMTPYLNYLSV